LLRLAVSNSFLLAMARAPSGADRDAGTILAPLRAPTPRWGRPDETILPHLSWSCRNPTYPEIIALIVVPSLLLTRPTNERSFSNELGTSNEPYNTPRCAFVWLASGLAVANAQTAVPTEVPATLNAVDFSFAGQANLGAPFQVDSGRLAETKGTSAAIRS
jgi:hypothetical protein